jgi:carboxypeptidase PM20D1
MKLSPNFRRIRKLFQAAGASLIAVMLARTVAFQPADVVVDAVPEVTISDGAAERLAGAIRIPTISHEDPAEVDGASFDALHRYLETSFPGVHAELRRETVGTHSLLYTWKGTDPSLKPILLMGHLDVVPIEPGTESKWQEAPFGGRIADGFIWGRGSIDNKSTVIGTLEAVEMLVREGFRPSRTIYLAFGHDEEVGGTHGAREIATLLARRGVALDMVLDEGGVIGDGVLSGISSPVALVGIAEKGFVSVELGVHVPGGHSSMPPRQSAVGILSAAIARLEEHPMPSRLSLPIRKLLEETGPRQAFPRRVMLANLWLTSDIVTRTLESRPTTNAMVRTTTAATIFQAGEKDNVLPSQARAVVNFRILPGDSSESVIEHVRTVVDDPRIEIRNAGRFTSEPSSVSSTDSESFHMLARTIRITNPDAFVAPYLVVVVTDSRYFADLSPNIFRFLPVRLTTEDLERMHGTNERLAVHTYEQAIRLYRQLIRNAAN